MKLSLIEYFLLFSFFPTTINTVTVANISNKVVEKRPTSVNVKLTRYLLSRRTKKTRPVQHPHDTLVVNVLAALYQIVDVDQHSNLVGISAFFDMWWMDTFLVWNPDDFGNVTQTYLPAHDVWTPDLYLYHSVQGSTALLVDQSAVSVNHEGVVRIFIPFTAKALCPINVKYFPFDNQTCAFVFGSWSYQERDVSYKVLSDMVDLNDFYDNQEWRLSDSRIFNSRSEYMNGFVNESYSTVTMILSITRESFYYIFNLVVPSTLVTLVAIMGFHVSITSTERRMAQFRLGIMTLLSMGVLLLNVVDDMPKFGMYSIPGKRGSFSDVPLLGIYYLTLIIVVSMATYTTSLFVKMEKYAIQYPHQIPNWIRWLSSPHLFSAKHENPNTHRKDSINVIGVDSLVNSDLTFQQQADQIFFTSRAPSILNASNVNNSYNNNYKSMSTANGQQNLNKTFAQLTEVCGDILREITVIRLMLEKKADNDQTKEMLLTPEWATLIRRVEMLSLTFYLTFIATSLFMFYYKDWY